MHDAHRVVTDDVAPANKSDVAVSPHGRSIFSLATVRAANLDAPFQVVTMGTATVSRLQRAGIKAIGRFGGVGPGEELVQIESLEGRLTLDGFDQVQCVLATRGTNSRMPKADYAT